MLKRCPRVANQFVRWQIRFSIRDRKFETSQTLGNERPDVTVHYPDIGVRNQCYSYGVAAVWCEFIQQHYRQASGMGEAIRYSAEDVPSQRSLSCVKKVRLYNGKNLSTLAGHCEGWCGGDESAGRPAARHSAWYII